MRTRCAQSSGTNGDAGPGRPWRTPRPGCAAAPIAPGALLRTKSHAAFGKCVSCEVVRVGPRLELSLAVGSVHWTGCDDPLREGGLAAVEIIVHAVAATNEGHRSNGRPGRSVLARQSLRH